MYADTNTVSKADGRAVPWNKRKLIGQKPPLKLKEIWAIRIRLQLDHRTRELALFNPSYRQQVARLRFGRASGSRCGPGQSCRPARDCHAEEDATTGAI